MAHGDKRSVATDALETLGTIIDDKAGRDAIHLAVEPVVADEKLYPGQDVGLSSPGHASAKATKLLGIVDPFLKAPVMPGEMFWLVVYPRTITSLRHVWSHPDFPEFPEPQITIDLSKPGFPVSVPALSVSVGVGIEDKAQDQSRAWIRNFADGVGLSYRELMDGAENYLSSGDYMNYGSLLESESVPEEFWEHYEVVTGKTVPENDKHNFFSCSC